MGFESLRHSRVWRDGKPVPDELPLELLTSEINQSGRLGWIDLVAPTPADLQHLVDGIGLDASAVEDLTAPHERPKVTRYPTHLFFQIYATSLRRDPDDSRSQGLRLSLVSGFVLPHVLVTVRPDDTFDIEEVMRRWEDNFDVLGAGPGALVHGLFDTVVDARFDTVQALDDAIEDLEDVLFEERPTGKQFQRAVYGLRKDLVQLRRVVLPMREVVNGLMRHRPSGTAELDSMYDDLYDHVLRASEWTESLRDMVTSLFETNLSLQDARLNTVMKKLAGWAAIVAVPTAVTGWFGQNVPYPGFGHASGMWMSIALIILLAGGLYAIFKRLDWI